MNSFLYPRKPNPFVNAQGNCPAASSEAFPDMSPVVVEGHMGDEGFYHIEKIAYHCRIKTSFSKLSGN